MSVIGGMRIGGYDVEMGRPRSIRIPDCVYLANCEEQRQVGLSSK